ALGMAVGLPVQDLLLGLEAFGGLPHRCELVLERDGVSWINDSKATNVASVRSALAGLGGQQNVVLIAGGVGKEQEFDALQPEVEQHCRRVLTLGEAARDIELALAARTPVQRVGSLQEAVLRAREVVLPGDVVLLSPACASFDMFDSFEARGELFREAVMTTQEQPA
ncbi:MAG: cyanophycin synthetase, partial [Luminiphilus sp.]